MGFVKSPVRESGLQKVDEEHREWVWPPCDYCHRWCIEGGQRTEGHNNSGFLDSDHKEKMRVKVVLEASSAIDREDDRSRLGGPIGLEGHASASTLSYMLCLSVWCGCVILRDLLQKEHRRISEGNPKLCLLAIVHKIPSINISSGPEMIGGPNTPKTTQNSLWRSK
jgi:hypothetical protein